LSVAIEKSSSAICPNAVSRGKSFVHASLAAKRAARRAARSRALPVSASSRALNQRPSSASGVSARSRSMRAISTVSIPQRSGLAGSAAIRP
jgi:hypothetical protein